LAAGTVLFISAALQQAGMRTTTAGNAGFLTGLYVVFVPLILWLGWRERPSRMAVLSIFLAGAGAYLLSTGGRSFQLHPGDDLELLGAVFWALHVVIVAKFARGLDVLAFSTAQFLVCGLLNMGIGLWTEPVDLPSLAGMTWAILYTGIISVGLGYTLQVWAQRHTPPVTAALLLSAEAVLAAFFGYVLLGEALSLLQALGALAILAGIALAQWKVVR
ncbi:MAG: DMT family transporter, partial [Chloroflexi bacterium]|nr:DMT family transporter [Chloroflexota bacterium]